MITRKDLHPSFPLLGTQDSVAQISMLFGPTRPGKVKIAQNTVIDMTMEVL